MRTLHIIQGGVKNDKKWLERAAGNGSVGKREWVTPKSAAVGDELVFYVGRSGFFATGRVQSAPKPSLTWKNKYGAAVGAIQLIEPSISLASIQRHLPTLKWANYPRGIYTPQIDAASLIRQLIRSRRADGIPIADLDEVAVSEAGMEELRAIAVMSTRRSVTPQVKRTVVRARSQAIRLYVLARAEGNCEGCRAPAPFVTAAGSPYLEAHHVDRLADDGPDHPRKVIALCPNCHRKAHHGLDAKVFNETLRKRAAKLELRPPKANGR